MDIQKGHFVMLGVFAGIVILGAVLSIWADGYNSKTQKAWQDFASEYRLQYESKQEGSELPRVSGNFRRHVFGMWEERYRGSHDDGQHSIRTRIYLKIPGMPDGLAIYQRPAGWHEGLTDNLFSIVAGITGEQLPDAFMTGDAFFDEKWVTRANDLEIARAWLASANYRNTLDEFIAQDGFDIYDDGIAWTGSAPRTVDAIENLALKLEHYAERLE